MAQDVFLSYRSEDKESADRLCSELEKLGINCWIAPRNIPIGAEWPAAIVEAIGGCQVFVMILSSHSVNAKQISREAEVADKTGCQIITFRLEDVQPPPGLSYFLGNIQWLDGFGGQFDSAVASLSQLIKKAAANPPGPTRIEAVRRPAEISPLVPAERPGARRWMASAIAIGVVVIGLGLWFGLRPKATDPQAAPSDAIGEAKVVADRFLEERESGNVDQAWAETGEAFQKRVDKAKWLKAQDQLRAHGAVTNKLDGCETSGNGFNCRYTLAFADQTKMQDSIQLIRNQEGTWKVSRSEMRETPKS